MQLMRFKFSLLHVPGKELITADTLSRAPTAVSSLQDESLQEEVDCFVHQVKANFPASKERLKQIHEN